MPMQTQCGSKPNTRRQRSVHYCRRLLPFLDACGAFGIWTRCSQTMLYYTVKSANPDPKASPPIPAQYIRSKTAVTQPSSTADTCPTIRRLMTREPWATRLYCNLIGLSVSVRIFDAGYFPARSYMYYLPGSMTEMPGEFVTPHNLFAFSTAVETSYVTSLFRRSAVIAIWNTAVFQPNLAAERPIGLHDSSKTAIRC